ncbi:uncharacterized protein LOC117726242 isoform X2 [Cyclopterus lumpus]|uniref:uncharacterized protein LOC117726242 isoform X2 n=1 Tax=Cyclopterus lumpus TaxID=8103 RepID=UPI001486A0E3|nr:uncharacterized protein LOC117726242 isoform X2 [Cyclopterus lumpus]
MGKVNVCLKRSYIMVISVIATLSALMLAVTLFTHGRFSRVDDEVAEHLKMHYMMLQNNASGITDDLRDVHIKFQCCGLDQGYLDWGYDIPESCLCTEESTNPCVAAPRNSSLFEHMIDDQPIMIYKESCLPYFIVHVMRVIDATIGIILGVILLWISSVVLCIFILCRLSKKEDVPVVVYSSEAKAGNYTALTDTAEHT